MTTDDRYARLKEDIRDLKVDVRDLRQLLERVKGLETKFEERDKHRSEETDKDTVKWLKWAVIVSLLVGLGGLLLGAAALFHW